MYTRKELTEPANMDQAGLGFVVPPDTCCRGGIQSFISFLGLPLFRNKKRILKKDVQPVIEGNPMILGWNGIQDRLFWDVIYGKSVDLNLNVMSKGLTHDLLETACYLLRFIHQCISLSLSSFSLCIG